MATQETVYSEPDVPNLDGMTDSELRDFWSKWHRASRRQAVELVGVRSDAAECAAILACYAMNTICARGLRLEGKIQGALVYEHAAQLAYDRLPRDLRW